MTLWNWLGGARWRASLMEVGGIMAAAAEPLAAYRAFLQWRQPRGVCRVCKRGSDRG